jgi:hypothetical protein
MNRRSFLTFLGVGMAAVVVAPVAVKAVVPSSFDTSDFHECTCGAPKPLIGTAEEWCPVHGSKECLESITASTKEYADYESFSDFQISSAIHASVNEAAAQLGYRAGLSI